MPTASYNPNHKDVLDALLLPIPGVRAGKMFGYPAWFVGRKLFACVYEDGVGIRVPEELSQELLSSPDVTPFRPMGKPRMGNWVQINHGEPLRGRCLLFFY
ncbi:MAG: hypothetical protein ED859_14910 [Desulfuromonadales bacterium]|nr:MAG: hypothetical protein ED859_14910 [Desulfuromonadales bacterium]